MFRHALTAPESFTADDSVLGVALVFPLQGPAGIFGPTCELCARLAAEEVNRDGGVLGREDVLTELNHAYSQVRAPFC